VLVAVIAVAAGNLALILWAAAVGAIAGGATIWARMAWRGVELSARFRPGRAFLGESVTLRVQIVNTKRLPLPLTRLSVWLPPGLRSADPSESATIRGFRRRVSMPGRSKLSIDLPVAPQRRGEYWLERVRVELADPFDLAPVHREVVPEADLLVMPEPRIAIPATIRRRLPFGAPAPSQRMFEDRERFAGVRQYEPGDPLNRVHWKLSAHAGKLHIKLFEPTRSARVQLALDLATGEPFWDSIYPEIAEDVIGWASFLARQAVNAGWRVGLVANTHLSRGRGPLRVPASSAKGQEAALFAALARMPNEASSDLAPILRVTGRGFGREAMVVVVSPRPGRWLQQEMTVLRRRGAEVLHLSPLEVS
jgi:uncharacterized protein (DUF58 family)